MSDNFINYDSRILNYHKIIRECILDIAKQKRTHPKIAEITSYLMLYKSLTQKQLKKLTGFSIGSISTYLTILNGLNLINKERIHGTHTYKYSNNIKIEDFLKVGLDIFLNSFNPSDLFLEKKKEELHILAEKNEEGADFLLKRVDSLLKTFKIYKKIFVPVLQKLNEHFSV